MKWICCSVLLALLGPFAAAAAAPPAAEAPAAPSLDVQKVERLFAAKLTSRGRAARVAAYEAYRAGGDDARTLLRDRLLAFREPLVARIREFGLPKTTQEKLSKVHATLAAAREQARKAIFEGEFKRQDVDAAVAEVKRVYAVHRDTFVPAVKRLEPIVAAHARLLEVDEELGILGGTGDLELSPTLAQLLDSVDEALLEALASERAFRDAAARCLRYNRAVRTSAAGGERHVVRLTNDHRLLLGIRPMAINEYLVRAARRHSLEMKQLGYFSHTSPVPDHRSFGARCKRQGYDGGPAGENIFMGGGAEGAFRAWYYSAGHHRNMANPARNEIGVGQAGIRWTEDFGSRNTLDLDRPTQHWPSPSEQHEKSTPARATKAG